MENVVKLPDNRMVLDLQKTVENIANNDVQHAIIITLHTDNSFKVHTTADDDLTAELLWDSLTMYEGKNHDGELRAEITENELTTCEHCGSIIDK